MSEEWKSGDFFIVDNGSRKRIGMVLKKENKSGNKKLYFMLLRTFGSLNEPMTFEESFKSYCDRGRSRNEVWSITKVDFNIEVVTRLLEDMLGIE